jgi:allantoin racemase
MMKILLANPNTSQSVTDRIAQIARQAAAPGTEILAVTANSGVPYIASRAEAASAGRTTLELMAEYAQGCDAAIVAAFGDPGLGGARELLSIPVVGLAEASMLTACMLGRRFSIVTFSRALEPWYRECVEYHGLMSRFASIRCAEGGFSDIATVSLEKESSLLALCDRVINEDGADVIILGGAPLAGMASSVCQRVAVPLIDGVAAAVAQAQSLVALRPRKATAGSFRRPPPKPITGVSVGLTRLFGAAE